MISWVGQVALLLVFALAQSQSCLQLVVVWGLSPNEPRGPAGPLSLHGLSLQDPSWEGHIPTEKKQKVKRPLRPRRGSDTYLTCTVFHRSIKMAQTLQIQTGRRQTSPDWSPGCVCCATHKGALPKGREDWRAAWDPLSQLDAVPWVCILWESFTSQPVCLWSHSAHW